MRGRRRDQYAGMLTGGIIPIQIVGYQCEQGQRRNAPALPPPNPKS